MPPVTDNPATEAPPRPFGRTLLDSIETTVSKRAFLQSRSGGRQSLVEAERLIENATFPSHVARAERIAHCCNRLWVGRDDEGPTIFVSRCRQRMCPECERINSKILAHTLASRVDRWRSPKFLTLTMRPGDCSLREQITRILRAFNRLRTHSVWKQLVRGGIYVVEITRAKDRHHWHVHLHVLMDAEYVPHAWLSGRWAEITGGSKVVYIEKADRNSAKYLAKYLSKSAGERLEDWERWPFWEELHGKRLHAAFGDEPKLSDGDGTEKTSMDTIGTLSSIVEKALDGDVEATLIISQLAERYPYLFTDVFDQIVSLPPTPDRDAEPARSG